MEDITKIAESELSELNKKLDNARKVMAYLREGNIGDKELLDFVLYLIEESKNNIPSIYKKIKEVVE